MQSNRWLVAVTVMLPTLMVIIDTSVVNVSLDHIRGSLSAGVDEATWSITSYLAANAIMIPMTGWMSRYFGRKRYLNFSIALFTLSSLLCGAAWSIESLIFFRIVQGIAGGSLQPISQSILLETFPPAQHGTAMAIYGAGVMIGPVIGPVLGGWITDNWSWPWIFYINIPMGVISIIMSMVFIVDPHYMKALKVRIDYWGLAFLAIGIGCLQMVLDRGERYDWFSSEAMIWMSLIAVSALALFVVIELFYAEHPIVDLRVFKNSTFTLGNILIIVFFVNLFGSIVLLPLYLQTLMGYTATLAGIVLGPGAVASIISMPLAGKLVNRINPKLVLAAGLVSTAYASYLMYQFDLHTDFVTIFWARAIQGFTMSFVFIPLLTLTLSGIKKERMANATSVFNSLRTLGASFGVAFISNMLARRAQFHQSRLTDHLTPFDQVYQGTAERLTGLLQGSGFDPVTAGKGSLALIYESLKKQAAMMAFSDVFFLLAFFLIAILPLVFFLVRIRHGEESPKAINKTMDAH